MNTLNTSESQDPITVHQSEILSLSDTILQAICAHDRQALEPILSESFVLLGNTQRTDRRAFLEAVCSGDFVAIDASFETIDIEVLGTTAVAAGIQRVEVELPDCSRAVSRSFFTDIFVGEQGRWLLRMAHSVELP